MWIQLADRIRGFQCQARRNVGFCDHSGCDRAEAMALSCETIAVGQKPRRSMSEIHSYLKSKRCSLSRSNFQCSHKACDELEKWCNFVLSHLAARKAA